MYHFVRELRRTRYPAIKGLETEAFVVQLEFFRRHRQVVRMEDVVAAANDPDVSLPDGAVLLTFDDGYAEHYGTVFPLLDRYGFQGSFFPPGRAILERKVLDVNKIHFLLAAGGSTMRLVDAMEAHVADARAAYDLEPLDAYRATYARPNRWDPADVIYLKRMLQRGLPAPVRSVIVDDLFREFVGVDEGVFADELYATVEQLKTMQRHGMHIGSHSYDHVWLDALPPDEQVQQVRASLAFLRDLGGDPDDWTMCFPYGGYDEGLLGILANEGCRLGLAAHAAVADLDRDHRLALPRIDANDVL